MEHGRLLFKFTVLRLYYINWHLFQAPIFAAHLGDGQDVFFGPASTNSLAGLMSAAQSAKLAGIEANAINVTPLLGQANGIATLDGTGKLEVGQIPFTNLVFQGAWDASLGSPPSGSPTVGFFWATSVAGNSVTLPPIPPGTTFNVGDWVLYALNGWNRVPNNTLDTNLSTTSDATTVTIENSNGTDAVLTAATASLAGLLLPADFSKLGTIEEGAEANVDVDLSLAQTETTATIVNTGGDNVEIPSATDSAAGLLSAANLTKLNGIDNGAEANVGTDLDAVPAANQVAITSSTGSGATILASSSTQAGVMTNVDYNKLASVEEGAEVNVPTDLSSGQFEEFVTVFSSTGDSASFLSASASQAGVLVPADKVKLDSVAPNAQENVPSNLVATAAAGYVDVTSSTATLPAARILPATDDNSGLLTPAQKQLLDTLTEGGQPNESTNLSNTATSTNVTISSSTGTGTTIAAATNDTAGMMSAGNHTKLAGIQAGAQLNQPIVFVGIPHADNYQLLLTQLGFDTSSVLLPLANNSEAGLMSPNMFTQVSLLLNQAPASSLGRLYQYQGQLSNSSSLLSGHFATTAGGNLWIAFRDMAGVPFNNFGSPINGGSGKPIFTAVNAVDGLLYRTTRVSSMITQDYKDATGFFIPFIELGSELTTVRAFEVNNQFRLHVAPYF